MPLTDSGVRNLKPGERPYKKFDGGGLFVLVTPTGSKIWHLKYRHGGKEKLISFGPFPTVGLKRAREKRDLSKLQLLDGLDPSEERKLAKLKDERERSATFGGLDQEYLEKLRTEGKAAQTLKKQTWLVAFTEADLGKRPISKIEAPDVLRVLKKVEAKGTYETAHRLRGTISSVFKFAVASGRASADPTEVLKGALITPTVRSRSAIVDREALGNLMLRISAFTGRPATKAALTLLALIAPRPGELRHARWDDFDFEEAVWRVPAERMKMRLPHRVPLSRQALKQLEGLHRLTGRCDLLFPSDRSWKKPQSENTWNAAIKRMGYSSKELTAHGFRSSFSTIANESGLWHADAIERALAHVESNDVRRAYLRGEHWDERVKLAQWWADELDRYQVQILI